MQIIILKDTLAKGLNLISRAVSSRSTLPVLSNILIATDGPRLRLSATNLTVAITCWLEADIENDAAALIPGLTPIPSLTVPAKTFADVVATIASGDSVTLVLTDKALTLKASTCKTEIKGLPAAEFPLIPRGASLTDATITLDALALRNAIRKTAFCVATDDARPVLQGVFFKVKDGQGTFAATDGFRLSVAHISASGAPLKAILPAEALTHVDRILGDVEDEQTVTVQMPKNQAQAIFTMEGVELVSQLIEGQFPDYERIIHKTSSLVAEVHAAELLTAVKAVDIFARESDHTTRFTFEESGLRLNGQSAETGSGEAKVVARLTDSVASTLPFEIAFNARYVIDALKAFDDRCAIGLTGTCSPALLTSPAGDAFQMVIMPLKIGHS